MSLGSLHALSLFLGCAFGAEVIGTMAGFGAATILTPIAALFMDIKTAIAVVACFHLFGNASRLVFFGRRINWRVWTQFGLTGVVCSVAGAVLTAQLPSAIVRFALGIFLVGYVALSVLPMRRMQLAPQPSTLVGGGIFSGFVAGLIGTGGAIRSACLLAFPLSKEAYLGTSAAIALIVDATRLPFYLREGFLPASVLPAMLSLTVVAFSGSWVGQRLVRRVPGEVFRRFVLVMLALIALKLLLDGWHGLA